MENVYKLRGTSHSCDKICCYNSHKVGRLLSFLSESNLLFFSDKIRGLSSKKVRI